MDKYRVIDNLTQETKYFDATDIADAARQMGAQDSQLKNENKDYASWKITKLT